MPQGLCCRSYAAGAMLQGYAAGAMLHGLCQPARSHGVCRKTSEALTKKGGRGGGERVRERRNGGKEELGVRSRKREGLRPSALNPPKRPSHFPPKQGGL